MRKVYLVAFNTALATREAVTRYLDSQAEIHNWKAQLPFGVFVSTTLTAHDLAARLEQKFGVRNATRFIVTYVDPMQCQGRLGQSVWDIINDPNTAPTGSE
jgi:hypothetical protein